MAAAPRLRRLRFTREGKYFVGLCIGVGFAAINTGNNLLYLLLGWMMSAIIASGVLSERVLARLRPTRLTPGPVHAGRPFLMSIALENQKRRLSSFAVEVEDLQGRAPVDKRCFFLKVPPGVTQTTRYRHTFARRGLYQFTGFRMSTRFPFSLFKKSREIASAGEILVYPALVPVRAPATRPRMGGEERRERTGRGGEFFGLREYRHGDDRRDVHWPSTARLGRPVVREYEDEAHRQATVLVDNGLAESADEAARAELEAAVSLAASLCVHYLERGYRVSLIARGEWVPAGEGPTQRHRLLRALALLATRSPGTPFAAAPPRSAQNVLVARRGTPVGLAPAGIDQVVEAGA